MVLIVRNLAVIGSASAYMLGAGAAAFAESEESEVPLIEPDRRDFTSGTGIVRGGAIQVETGASWQRSASERQWSLNDTTLRIPLNPSVEVHVGLPSYEISHSDSRTSGFGDMTVEMRYRFFHSTQLDLAVQGTLVAPTGSRQMGDGDWQPGAIVAASIRVTPKFGWVTSIEAARTTVDATRFVQITGATSFRYQVGESWNVFSEAYVLNREAADGAAHRYIDVGTVFFLSRSAALDARVGKGIDNGDGTRLFVNAGFSQRF